MFKVYRVGVLLAALPLGGCSFVFVDSPPDHPERISSQSEVKCTTSKAAPVIDTLIAGYQGVRTAMAASASDADYSGAPISREADVFFGAGFLALFASSAIYGYVTTGNCKDAKASHGYERTQDAPDYQREVWTPPPSAQASEPTGPAPAPARICTPGSTQQCVGAGACSGGQACVADGSGWSPCDCADEADAPGAGQ